MKSHVHFYSVCELQLVRNFFVCVLTLVITATTVTTIFFETTDLWILNPVNIACC